MVENGYLIQERSTHDRRSVRVRVSEKGLKVCEHLSDLHRRHIEQLAGGPLGGEQLEPINQSLRQLERFWTETLAFGPRGFQPAQAQNFG
jgi:DNA-binding MarR family transcriptional regulator